MIQFRKNVTKIGVKEDYETISIGYETRRMAF